jgi:hypothetical protein
MQPYSYFVMCVASVSTPSIYFDFVELFVNSLGYLQYLAVQSFPNMFVKLGSFPMSKA